MSTYGGPLDLAPIRARWERRHISGAHAYESARDVPALCDEIEALRTSILLWTDEVLRLTALCGGRPAGELPRFTVRLGPDSP